MRIKNSGFYIIFIKTVIEYKDKLELLMKQMAKKENITEELKSNNQMKWVQKMNNIKVCAEEIILNEVIYK